MKALTTITLLIVTITIISGCGDASRPKDLPKLYPCTVTITQEGKPLADAMIEFVPADAANAKFRAVSMTGKDGSVKMATYGFTGAPAGKYKVVVTKTMNDDIVYAAEVNPSSGEKDIVSYNTYRMVDEQYSSAETTPFEIEITGKERSVTKTFDAGKAVKVKTGGSGK
ncbi:MAG: hypothetical protein LBH00_06285 [Planctomycetaceae bacterium]|jgi:hypothetical protein|nr:hypothetical protein [Planctomycetaceae bacterium]